MAEETGHGGKVKSSKSTTTVLGYAKRPGHLKMTSTLWRKNHMRCLRQCKRLTRANLRLIRQDNINHHMCHMRMSLKAQTHFNTIRNVRVISPHCLPPPQRLACLSPRTALQMRLRHCPPSQSSPVLTLSHPCPYHPYTCVVPSRHASDTAYHPYACECPPKTAYHPYARECPPKTAYHPYTLVVPSRHAPNTTYDP
ncbi:hypothetical protein O181_033187 [Austropuccinia psidii MF-1]|uniref:Uncharacterized protein n=1 Tax=Austropuccinia psidii MF-1 TaxID=1389203 RepID=A0A9Q3D439_9BASI|nr:hypothetical protein [Austropuccinia psidii MF-1]